MLLLCWPIATFFKNVAINPLFSDARKKHRNIPLFATYLKTSQKQTPPKPEFFCSVNFVIIFICFVKPHLVYKTLVNV